MNTRVAFMLSAGLAIALIDWWARRSELLSNLAEDSIQFVVWLALVSPLCWMIASGIPTRAVRVALSFAFVVTLLWRLSDILDDVPALDGVALIGHGGAYELRDSLQVATTVVLIAVLVVLFNELSSGRRERKLILDNAPCLLAHCSADMKYLFVNQRYEEWFGRPAEQLVGKHVWDLVGQEAWETMKQQNLEMLSTGEMREFDNNILINGAKRWFRVRLVPELQHGKTVGYYALILENTQQKLAEQDAERERNILRRLLEINERERQQFSMDIHDGLVQYAVGAKMLMDSGDPGQLATASEYLGKTIDEGRRLMQDLRHPVLDEQGLAAGIRHLVADVQAHCDVKISLDWQVESELPSTLSNAIYRIAHEALHNARRHSGAKTIHASVRQSGDWLHLQVGDSGSGFDRAAVPPDRFGLVGIEERARLFGGKAKIESTPGMGTQVSVDMPCCCEHYR